MSNTVIDPTTVEVSEGESFSFYSFMELATWFHNYPAPGLLLGGFMVEEAKRYIPDGVLYDAVSETTWCLPDAIQLLTPCTLGNGWLRVRNNAVYALSLFDKHSGEGVRVRLDPEKLDAFPHTLCWLMKTKPKNQQDSEALRHEIRDHSLEMLSVETITVKPEVVMKRSKGAIVICPLCGDAYPEFHGAICRGCSGDSPYMNDRSTCAVADIGNSIPSTPLELSIGKKIVHDMTRIVPGESKDVEFSRGHVVTAGDVCRLQQMGRFNLYVDQEAPHGFIHEDDAARAFSQGMCGEGVVVESEPREGKVNLLAERDGIMVVDEPMVQAFNSLPNVIAACRQGYSLVRKGRRIAATRAIPLFLEQAAFGRALAIVNNKPFFSVMPLRSARVGLLITGNEVFKGLIKDRFADVIEAKVTSLGSTVVASHIRPDDSSAIADAARSLEGAGCDLIVTTAGLSVDPDDVTRQGLMEAGLTDALYGFPVLPGAMTLIGRIGQARVLGVPACALFHKTTSLDLLLPRLLADLPITRADAAKLGNGGMCMECTSCTFPKCPFGR
ncbi:FmdE family protein [Pseudodesulfovibrio piezophilus]|uniref:Formylmethanofuran dehydrogenase subunit E region n=1 Tax=Pseudodesulfovibrio piezophilus (strain DSM 21447 / JCM 15486 / C1TLV30) TaxID=1322246 RepID=M1WY95_PSEP2|nr:FmdE family protein [Pseudodesulfovibrio piezophilus]CCH50218.1 Formylmethanofuran dehydrogenase subunit E region [Pseudodesulfovibrio piezophilus C1TLV30]